MQRTTLQSAERTGIRFAVLFLFLASFTVVSIAQTTQQFTGHVLDSTGAVIPNAEVIVHNNATGIDIRTFTTAQGVYTVPYLQPGAYDITVSGRGFKSEKKTNIPLNVAQVSTIDFQLSVGVVTEVVTVEASNAQLELSKADRSELIDSKRVAELPLDSRNPFGLLGLSPGIHDFSQQVFPRPFDDVTNNIYVNGSPERVALNIDGLTNDAGGGTKGFSTNAGLVPSVDVVQEFKVVVNGYDASNGHTGGASVDVALKSGGNQFHGVVDYYMRRKWLDTPGFQAKYLAALAGDPKHPVKPNHKRDQYSIELDGPVVIPHLFNGKNKKLFFVASYEQMNDTQPASATYNTYSLPNPAWLGCLKPGVDCDLSSAQYWNNATQSLQPLLIYDPLTPLRPVVDPNDGKTKQAHAQFPGNRIPANRIDPVGRMLLGYLARIATDQPGKIVNPGAGFAPYTNNFKNLWVEDNKWRNGLFKVDYSLSDRDRFSFRWGGQGRWKLGNPGPGLLDSNPANQNEFGAQPVSQTGSAQWTHTFSSNLLLNVGASLMTQKNKTHYGTEFSNGFLNSLGFSPAFTSQLQFANLFPNVNPGAPPNAAGYPNLMQSTTGTSWYEHALGILPTVTYIRGAHTLRGGLDMQFRQWANPFGANNNRFDFNNGWTNRFGPGFADATNYSSGSSIASLLLGYPSGGSASYSLHQFLSWHTYSPWVQDDWKVSKKLTLNFGLRWDFLTPRVERSNQMTGAFNQAVVNPVSSQIPAGTPALGTNTNLMGGLEFAGVNGRPRTAFAMNKWNIGPRIGFAYAVTPRMVLRGGIGKTYIYNPGGTYENGASGFSSSTGYNSSLDGGVTPYTATTGQGLSNPIPTVLTPTGSSLGYLQNLGSGLGFFNPHFHIPSVWSYSLTYEVSLTKNDIVSASYVGNHTWNDRVDDNINHISPAWNAQCDLERGGNRLLCDLTTNNQIANPFKGIAAFKGTNYFTDNTLTKSNFTRPFPEFGDITMWGAYNNGQHWYDALQVTARHQFSKSLTANGSYTHARDFTAGSFLDNVNRIRSRQMSTTNDVKHAVNLSGVMYLPLGKNHAWFSNANRLVDSLVNGWEFSPVFEYFSGFAWRPNVSTNNWEFVGDNPSMGIGHTILPPDSTHSFARLRGVTPCVGTRDRDTGAIIPGPAAIQAGCTKIQWVTAPTGYAVARNVTDFGVRRPGAYTFNASLAKNFRIPEASKLHLSEGTNLQLRVDIFNVFNHANLDNLSYNANPASADFGTLPVIQGGTSNQSRFLQLSAKLTW